MQIYNRPILILKNELLLKIFPRINYNLESKTIIVSFYKKQYIFKYALKFYRLKKQIAISKSVKNKKSVYS